jgi:hypothetical protein
MVARRHTVGVHGRDRLVVRADVEGNVEILRHGTEVTDGRGAQARPRR